MENKQIEVLEKLIALKDETIKELERQLQLLKNQPPIVIPQFPSIPQYPFQPISPQWPWGSPYYGQPLIVSGTTNAITNDPNITYTFTNSDGSTNVIDLKTCSRV